MFTVVCQLPFRMEMNEWRKRPEKHQCSCILFLWKTNNVKMFWSIGLTTTVSCTTASTASHLRERELLHSHSSPITTKATTRRLLQRTASKSIGKLPPNNALLCLWKLPLCGCYVFGGDPWFQSSLVAAATFLTVLTLENWVVAVVRKKVKRCKVKLQKLKRSAP